MKRESKLSQGTKRNNEKGRVKKGKGRKECPEHI